MKDNNLSTNKKITLKGFHYYVIRSLKSIQEIKKSTTNKNSTTKKRNLNNYSKTHRTQLGLNQQEPTHMQGLWISWSNLFLSLLLILYHGTLSFYYKLQRQRILFVLGAQHITNLLFLFASVERLVKKVCMQFKKISVFIVHEMNYWILYWILMRKQSACSIRSAQRFGRHATGW